MQSCVVGVVGMGNIGSEVIRLLQPFGPRFLAFDVAWDARFADSFGVTRATLEEPMERADLVTIHVSLNPGTRHLINAVSSAR